MFMYFVWKRVAVKQCAFFVFIGSLICLINTMNDYLEQFLLEVVKDHLKSLSDEQFLALSCNLTTLHDGLIRQVYNQALVRKFRAPNRVTADVFGLTKSGTIKNLRKTLTN